MEAPEVIVGKPLCLPFEEAFLARAPHIQVTVDLGSVLGDGCYLAVSYRYFHFHVPVPFLHDSESVFCWGDHGQHLPKNRR